ncbi:MAG: family 10 glycosylhydrolase [Limnochordaceae bacterium]|nr:family 10 glycosylhydrolase [Limnochordaceae bacterium]
MLPVVCERFTKLGFTELGFKTRGRERTAAGTTLSAVSRTSVVALLVTAVTWATVTVVRVPSVSAAVAAGLPMSLGLVQPIVSVGAGDTDGTEGSETIPLAGVNFLADRDHPGPVVYLPGNAQDTRPTLTPAGYLEAIVRQGVVERLSIAGNSPVPSDGFVLSVPPDQAMTLIQAGVKVGQRMSLDLYHVEKSTLSVQHSIDGFDTSRGTDQLIVYRPRPGSTRTLTNQWGIEVEVVNGRVTSVGGNNRPIPPNGLVLSGHGAAAAWLRENAHPGQKVDIGADHRVTLTTDATSYVLAATSQVEAARQALAAARVSWADADFTTASRELAAAQSLLAQAQSAQAASTDPNAVIRSASQAMEAAYRAWLAAQPSGVVGLRGAWYRAVETTPEEIAATLDRMKAAGINTLFLETFYDGQALWPSALVHQLPQFEGWDPLQVWIDEAHKRGIELHAWMHIFNVGERGGDGGPLLVEHPDWALRRPDGSVIAAFEPGLSYVDPADPGARAFLQSLYKELVTKYDLDGFEYDYIRYPEGTGTNPQAIAYSEGARQAYLKETGVDPATLLPAKGAAWQRWNSWRRQQVTSFVESTSKLLRSLRPNLKLSAAVFGDPQVAFSNKLQDWPTWLRYGYLDFVSAMAYSDYDAGYVGQQAQNMAKRAAPLAFAATGISVTRLNAEGLLQQTGAVLGEGNPGVVFFAFNYVDSGGLRELLASFFRLPAVPPYRLAEASGRLAERVQARLAAPDDPLGQAAAAHPEAIQAVNQALERIRQATASAAEAADRSSVDKAAFRSGLEDLKAALTQLIEAEKRQPAKVTSVTSTTATVTPGTTATAPETASAQATTMPTTGAWLLEQIGYLVQQAQ